MFFISHLFIGNDPLLSFVVRKMDIDIDAEVLLCGGYEIRPEEVVGPLLSTRHSGKSLPPFFVLFISSPGFASLNLIWLHFGAGLVHQISPQSMRRPKGRTKRSRFVYSLHGVCHIRPGQRNSARNTKSVQFFPFTFVRILPSIHTVVTFFCSRFTPEHLGAQASQILAWLIVEVLLVLLTFYITNISSNLRFLHLLAFIGYKYAL